LVDRRRVDRGVVHPAIVLAKRAGSSTAEFFTSGRAAPWWLLGVSMVATTFSTDTPNLVTNLVREKGVANNWAWWAFLLTGMATVFFYARLWRRSRRTHRSRVLRDSLFRRRRQSRARLPRHLPRAVLQLRDHGAVNLAAAKIANVVLGWPMWQTLLICAVLNVAFAPRRDCGASWSPTSIQFVIAMTGSFAAAYFALKQPQVGGMAGLLERIRRHAQPAARLRRLAAHAHRVVIPLTDAVVVGVVSRRGAGRRQLHRAAHARREERARRLAGTLFFNAAHYALRPWPWIIVALSSLLVYPNLSDIASTFPYVDPSSSAMTWRISAMLKFLPHGFLGLMVAGMLAAYVSTLSTHLNWGTSYLVHDFYRRFVSGGRDEKALRDSWVAWSPRCSCCWRRCSPSCSIRRDRSFELLMSVGAGTGLLYLLRWYWWRINAVERDRGHGELVHRGGVLLHRREGRARGGVAHRAAVHRRHHYGRLGRNDRAHRAHRPRDTRQLLSSRAAARSGWEPVRAEAGAGSSTDRLSDAHAGMGVGLHLRVCGVVRSGSLLYRRWAKARVWVVLFVISTVGLVRLLPRLWRGSRVIAHLGASA
jgi:hypothetical protein